MAIVDRVRRLVEPLVDDASVNLYDIEHNGATSSGKANQR